MAFLHCHDCDWQQDDFWDPKTYMPIGTGYTQEQVNTLVRALEDPDARFIEMDHVFARERYGAEGGKVEVRVYLAVELELTAKQIRGMHWMTYEDYMKDPNKVCPKCGSKELDID